MLSACTANVYGESYRHRTIIVHYIFSFTPQRIQSKQPKYIAAYTQHMHSPESLSITQRLASPRPPPTEESLELEESSDESDELDESSDPAAAQNFDMVFQLLPALVLVRSTMVPGWTQSESVEHFGGR